MIEGSAFAGHHKAQLGAPVNGPYKGNCLCGSVRFEADTLLAQAAHCHCATCRKFHGAAFATIGSIPKRAFRWTAGENEINA